MSHTDTMIGIRKCSGFCECTAAAPISSAASTRNSGRMAISRK
jgi:hypothetical protein